MYALHFPLERLPQIVHMASEKLEGGEDRGITGGENLRYCGILMLMAEISFT